MTTSTLNQGQDEAATAFFQFLFSDEPFFIISGPGGVGKTHLMSHMIDQVMPEYFRMCQMLGIKPEFDQVMMTATTNKAAEVLAQATKRMTSTVHSYLNLKVMDDFATGKSKITKTNQWRVHERTILFIDESSMIDTDLLAIIREGMHKSKVIFVGDHCQLAPVMEPISPIYRQKTPVPFYHLTEQMRNSGQPALMDICQQLRDTVETGDFKPIQIVPGVIDLLDDRGMELKIAETFGQPTTSSRILSYTNGRVIQYNEHIRSLRQLPHEYQLGEFLVNNSAIRLKGGMLSVEEEVEINRRDTHPHEVLLDDNVKMLVRNCDLVSKHGEIHYNVPVPCDRAHYAALLDYYRKVGKSGGGWSKYYELKNNYPDLRQFDAATVHKSQGSTYDEVFIDLGNISTCHQPNAVARMLYVAFSRPRSRIYLYGNLADKYGGLVI